MLHVALYTCWAILIFVSSIGWGRLAVRLSALKMELDWGFHAALGLASLVVVGGVLNLLGLISPPLIIVLICLGAVIFVRSAIKSEFKLSSFLSEILKLSALQKPILKFDTFIFFFLLAYLSYLLLLPFLATVYAPVTTDETCLYNLHDDLHAYFVWPQKMLQMGCMGAEPFSHRRLFALGGQYFLHTLARCVFDASSYHMVEHALGPVILCAGILSFCRSLNLSRNPMLVAAVLPLCLSRPYANITSLMTGLVLFFALFRLIHFRAMWTKFPWSATVLIAIVASALCALKLNYLPGCILVFAFHFFLLFTYLPWRHVFIHMACILALTGLFLMPWMIAMRQSSGTYFYPFLGHGWASLQYELEMRPVMEWNTTKFLTQVQQVLLTWPAFWLAALAVLAYFKPIDVRYSRIAALCMCVCALGTELGLSFVMPQRYAFAIWGAAYAVLLPLAFLPMRNKSGTWLTMYGGPVLVVAGVLGFNQGGLMPFLGQIQNGRLTWHHLKDVVRNPTVVDPQIDGFVCMQNAVPAGATILARLDKPYLMNFARNPVYIIDFPGACGLPPGIPTSTDPDILREYLLFNNIQYLAYSWNNQANFSKREFGWRVFDQEPATKTQAYYTFHFQDAILALASKVHVLYIDSDRFVLDLKAPNRQTTEIELEAESFKEGNVTVDFTVYGVGIGVITSSALPAFAEYTVDIQQAGYYNLTYRCAAKDSRQFKIDIDKKITLNAILPELGPDWMTGSQKWNELGLCHLEAGKHVVRLDATAPIPHLDKFRLSLCDGP